MQYSKRLLSKIKDQSNRFQEQDSVIREDKNRDNRESKEGEFGGDKATLLIKRHIFVIK